MKTERVFLMELFLDDELPKKIKLMIKDRFQELEDSQRPSHSPGPSGYSSPDGLISPAAERLLATQSPSMQRMMAQNPDLMPPAPVTPAAAQALAARRALINSAMNENPEGGRKSPRKI